MGGYEYTSCIAPQVRAYLRHRRAAGAACTLEEENLHYLDAWVARERPGATELEQGMVDEWCARRDGESANACRARCWPVVSLVRFLRLRGETGVEEPELPRPQESGFVPHAFTDGELEAFFRECDAHEPRGTHGWRMRTRTKRTIPVVFRLLWSSGIRTVEARLLRSECVDLGRGALHIREGKGRSQRLVALHESMVPIMREYDEAMEALWPGRAYFFPNGAEGHISQDLLHHWFSMLWSRVSDEPARAYDLRHDFCIRCINQLVAGGIEGLRDLEWVSRAMGHTSVETTVSSYYHIVPALGAILQERCDGLADIIPDIGPDD